MYIYDQQLNLFLAKNEKKKKKHITNTLLGSHTRWDQPAIPYFHTTAMIFRIIQEKGNLYR